MGGHDNEIHVFALSTVENSSIGVTGVAANSLHLVGKAIDIRSPGRELHQLQKVALSLRGGGVGYYPQSNFIHVDIGRVRYW